MRKHYTLSGLLLCLMTLLTLSASATPDKDYLCFTANTAGSTVELAKEGIPGSSNIEYSTDGSVWTYVDFIHSETTTGKILLANAGNKVYFRRPEDGVSEVFSRDDVYYHFIMEGSIAASGNVMSLIDKSCTTTEIPYEYCFFRLFLNCTALKSAPYLPATTLDEYCYANMFQGCTGLESAPALPATTLAR